MIGLSQNGQLCSRNIYMAASVSESLWSGILETSSKLFKIIAMMKHYNETFLINQFSRKVPSFCFNSL